MPDNQFSKLLYVKFDGSPAPQKMFYENSVACSNEAVIQYVKESFPKGEVMNVLIVEK